jgi:hypothetical protein
LDERDLSPRLEARILKMKFLNNLWYIIKAWLEQKRELEQAHIACEYLLEVVGTRDIQLIELTHSSEDDVHESMVSLVRQEPVQEGPATQVEHFQGNAFKHILQAMRESPLVGLK